MGMADQRALDRARLFPGESEMSRRMRAFDWSATPLGPAEEWPQSLRSAVGFLLCSKAQIVLFWGPELISLYNDAYAPVYGAKHPGALGLPVAVMNWLLVMVPLSVRVMRRSCRGW